MDRIKKIWFNGKEYETKQNLTINNLICYFNYNSLFIIEYNFIMCNKGLWDKISIEDGDKIEVITLVGGG